MEETMSLSESNRPMLANGRPAALEQKKEKTSDAVSARQLKWVGLGIGGLGLIAAPDAVAALVGLTLTRRTRNWTRALGATQLVTVLGMLARGRAADRASGSHDVVVKRAITVNRPLEEVYLFWHDFGNFPRFMSGVGSVEPLAEGSRWRVKGPPGTSFGWEAIITADRPNEAIAWSAVREGGSEAPIVGHDGAVHFRRGFGGQGTEIAISLRYPNPGGHLTRQAAKLLGRDPSQQIDGDLRRFKQVMEIGEVFHSDASIHEGRHPAAPARRTESGSRK